MRKLLISVGLALAIGAALLAAAAQADFPYAPGGNPHDPTTFKLAPGTTPNDFSEAGDWKYAGTPEAPSTPPNPLVTKVQNQQDELCGIRGMSLVDTQTTQPAGSCVSGQPVKTAWEVSTGRPDVLITVLDSGIKWDDQGAMTELRDKVHLNQGELPAPRHDLATPLAGSTPCSSFGNATGGDYNKGGNYDVNNDGVFNVLDYACDSRVAAIVNGTSPRGSLRHGPAHFLTPEDLILAFSDGTDHDHNGFANDIAGWNFVDDNNNPYDDVHYGHGTGEAQDSNAEANNGGSVGTCPNCMVEPLRVGESFIADSNRFAQAVLYATDNGADIVQEALGTLNESAFTQQAIEYAYNHGVTVIASAADEAAEHHNQPGSLADTIVVNSVTKYDQYTQSQPSYLQFNGCTNFSSRVTLAVPSSSCSSEATGKSSGVAGLIYSAAENAVAAAKLQPSTDCTRTDGKPCVITPNEVRQLMASGDVGSALPGDSGTGQADDVNFAQQPEPSCSTTPAPTCTDPNKQTAFAADQNGGVVGPIPHTTRYPARKGFDEFYGYGRLNAYRAVNAAASGTIPPEADITGPQWFTQVNPGQSTFTVDGYVNARAAYKCIVEVAPGVQPNNASSTALPAGDFHQIPSSQCDGTTSHTGPVSGALGSVSISSLEALFPPGNPGSFNGNANGGLPQDSNGRPNTSPHAFTVRIVVTTTSGTPMTGEDRRQFFLHRDQDMLPHFPIELHTDGDSSPVLADLDGDNRNELMVATSDGTVHAFRPDGSELPGWPVHTDPLPLHTFERAYTSGGVGTGHYAAVLGALAVGDLFHDGRLEVVADDNQGNVYAWDAQGKRVFHESSNPNYSGAPIQPFKTVRNSVRDRTERGFLSSPVLADLDGHGLDIVAAGDDRHVYAWHADGSAVSGFPVLVEDPDKVAAVDPTTNHITFKNVPNGNTDISEDQGKIIDTPAVARLGGPHPSIVVGTNEEYLTGSGDEGAINASSTNSVTTSAVGQTGLLSFANGRVYAIKSDGNRGGHPFEAGWPKKVGIIDAGLLPDVGEGVNGSPVVAPFSCPSGGGGPKIGVTPDAGPAYVFNADGTSCYGQTNGADNTLETDFAVSAGKYDSPTFAAVGYPAFGTLDGQNTSFFAPVTGLIRALDVVASEYQGGQDFIGGWNPTLPSKQYLPNYPAEVNDLQFLTGPVVGDITGGSGQEVIGGTASQDLAAFNSSGTAASSAWPKLTGDWTVATPTLGSFGTLDSDSSAKKDVVSITRFGTLSVYGTPASACSPSSSPRFHHDNANSGDYTRDAVDPGTPFDMSYSKGVLSFRAPGNDLMCGKVNHYDLVESSQPLDGSTFDQGFAVPADQLNKNIAAPGGQQKITLAGHVLRYVLVRAVDDQGNVGPAVRVQTSPGPPNGGPCRDLIRPTSKVIRSLSKLTTKSLKFRGQANDHGCDKLPIAKRLNAIAVSVSIARAVSHHRCRFLQPNGTFTRARSCSKPVYLRATGAYSLKYRRLRWVLKRKLKLKYGRYIVTSRAVDQSGNVEKKTTKRNRLVFKLRKHHH
ncbi:MAG: hypothetical protein JOZ25_09545 [Actinobacteria bacterium]|nr:hypothetical protein [Actinomycetota bacterium]